MAKRGTRKRRSYPLEFRQQMVELVKAGRSPEEVGKEFDVAPQTIRNWLRDAKVDLSREPDHLTTAEREELNRLRRENRQLQLEREILSKAAAWFARETDVDPAEGFRVRERAPGRLSDRHDVPRAGGLPQRLLCVGEAAAVAARAVECRADRDGSARSTRARAGPMARRASMPSLRRTACAWAASGSRG